MGNSIATAYVQVVPSMDGVASNVRSYFGAAGNSSGSLLGTNLVGKLKTALATAGIGQALKASITEGADLQQSLGGIETMFKESAAIVIANAQQAYKTAGMSANSYMETVTSFSASLLQGLGGDTAKAADVANMALSDMSDNANKFGTDMESIKNAYQGFAKQNYTMLDNLKLGYGGTKTEMQRLLKDAQALSGVKYDISNLSDVYSAIHVIQEEMGIMGTTATEASSTLSGSFSSMKAAFSDVMASMALGMDMTQSLNALAETTVTFLAGNLLPAVWNVVSAVPGALVTFLKALIPGNMKDIVSTATSQFSTFLTGQLPTILNNGVQMITQLVTGFLSGVPGFLSEAGNMLQSLLSAILAALPAMLQSGVSLVLSMASGLVSSIPNIISSAASILSNLLSTIGSHLPEMLAQGISLIGELIAGLISMIPDVISAGGEIIANICDAFGNTDWLSIGSNIISGIASGIRNGVGKIIAAAIEAAKSALNAAKEFLEIQSPSRRFRKEVGAQVPAGIALGIHDNMDLVSAAMDDMSSDMLSSGLQMNTKHLNVAFGTSGSSGVYGRSVNVVQNIYSEAKTAADLMQEARYQQEMAVILGV